MLSYDKNDFFLFSWQLLTTTRHTRLIIRLAAAAAAHTIAENAYIYDENRYIIIKLFIRTSYADGVKYKIFLFHIYYNLETTTQFLQFRIFIRYMYPTPNRVYIYISTIHYDNNTLRK